MPVSDGALDLTATDVSEEAWEQLVTDMASEDPELIGITRHPVLTTLIDPGSCVLCACGCALPGCFELSTSSE